MERECTKKSRQLSHKVLRIQLSVKISAIKGGENNNNNNKKSKRFYCTLARDTRKWEHDVVMHSCEAEKVKQKNTNKQKKEGSAGTF